MQKVDTRIKLVRKTLGFTQKQFAERLGITQGYLSDIEGGRKEPSDTILTAMVYRFGLKMEWLLTGEDEMFIPERPPYDNPREHLMSHLAEHLPEDQLNMMQKIFYILDCGDEDHQVLLLGYVMKICRSIETRKKDCPPFPDEGT